MKFLSAEYKKLIEFEHKSSRGWGRRINQGIYPSVDDFIKEYNIEELLDYGCGRGAIRQQVRARNIRVHEYDPGRPEVSKSPEAQNYVVCMDVLEHIEPEFIEQVLDDLKRVTLKIGCFNIATRLAVRKLRDGRNAHLIVENADWWREKLEQRFTILSEVSTGRDSTFHVKALNDSTL